MALKVRQPRLILSENDKSPLSLETVEVMVLAGARPSLGHLGEPNASPQSINNPQS